MHKNCSSGSVVQISTSERRCVFIVYYEHATPLGGRNLNNRTTATIFVHSNEITKCVITKCFFPKFAQFDNWSRRCFSCDNSFFGRTFYVKICHPYFDNSVDSVETIDCS